MNTTTKYWIPNGVSLPHQIAMSIPGSKPPDGEAHEQRLMEVLRKLALELEEQQGKGAAWRQANEIVPDEDLFLAGEETEVEELMWILESADQLPKPDLDLIGQGSYNQDLQQACREATFGERLDGMMNMDY